MNAAPVWEATVNSLAKNVVLRQNEQPSLLDSCTTPNELCRNMLFLSSGIFFFFFLSTWRRGGFIELELCGIRRVVLIKMEHPR